VLEQTAGQTYEELLKEHIFMPLNMTSSTTQRENISDQLVKGVDRRGGEATNWDLASLVAAGGIYSSTEDMVRYALAQLDTTNNVYKYQKEPTYTISEDQQIALGWYIISREDCSEIYWHNGGTGGYRSSMALNPVNGTAVVVLSNISAGHAKSSLIDRLCFDLLRLADGLRPLDQKGNSDS
ncbi:MAG TPA: serine hydrolase domain-containing protein, partial [Gracilimonas sp.]|nr:serine hydrolase domain-containing protein [Gracilimonas sp.]